MRHVQESLDGNELHVDYIDEHGWFIYRHVNSVVGAIGSEECPSGQVRFLMGNRSACIRIWKNVDPDMNFVILPNLVMRWLINQECLVYQLVVQRNNYFDMSHRVVPTRAAYRFQLPEGGIMYCRALAWKENDQWTIHFQSRASDESVWSNMVYNRTERQWMSGRTPRILVPVAVARRLSRAVGIETRDGFWHTDG